MLIIRQSQIEELDAAASDSFTTEAVSYLKEKHPDAVRELDDDDLHRKAGYGIEKGQLYGLEKKKDLLIFLALMFEIAPCFSEHPAINRILTDKEMNGEMKMEAVLSDTSERDWSQVKFCYREEDWNLFDS